MRATAAVFSAVVIRGQPASQPVVKDVPPFRGSLQKISLISRAKLLRPLYRRRNIRLYVVARIRELSYPNSGVGEERERERERGVMVSGRRARDGGNQRVRQSGLDSG